MKRAADLAEALYSMPRNHLPAAPRSPSMSNNSGFNSYTAQLGVPPDAASTPATWDEGNTIYFSKVTIVLIILPLLLEVVDGVLGVAPEAL